MKTKKENKNANQRIEVTTPNGSVYEKYTPKYGRPFYGGRHKGGFSFIISAKRFNEVLKGEHIIIRKF